MFARVWGKSGPCHLNGHYWYRWLCSVLPDSNTWATSNSYSNLISLATSFHLRPCPYQSTDFRSDLPRTPFSSFPFFFLLQIFSLEFHPIALRLSSLEFTFIFQPSCYPFGLLFFSLVSDSWERLTVSWKWTTTFPRFLKNELPSFRLHNSVLHHPTIPKTEAIKMTSINHDNDNAKSTEIASAGFEKCNMTIGKKKVPWTFLGKSQHVIQKRRPLQARSVVHRNVNFLKSTSFSGHDNDTRYAGEWILRLQKCDGGVKTPILKFA